MEKKFEEILRKNFNDGMLGVRLNKTSFEIFKETYPSLIAVVYKSMQDARELKDEVLDDFHVNDKFFNIDNKVKIAVISDSKRAYNGFLSINLKTSPKHNKFIHIDSNDIERLQGLEFEKVFILKAHARLFKGLYNLIGHLKYRGAKEIIYI